MISPLTNLSAMLDCAFWSKAHFLSNVENLIAASPFDRPALKMSG
jgi:hypothetical protein